MTGFDAHHIFPQEFADVFKRAGIDIHDPQYGAWWELHEHRQKAKAYNAEWKEFLERDGMKTKEEIITQARAMAKKYGFEFEQK